MLRSLNNCYENFNFLVKKDEDLKQKEEYILMRRSIQKDREIEKLLGRYGNVLWNLSS